jgi:hypothetical protein
MSFNIFGGINNHSFTVYQQHPNAYQIEQQENSCPIFILKCCDDVTINPQCWSFINIGIKIFLQIGYYGRIG